MTREEAIKALREMADGMPEDKCSDWIDACLIAIRSLEAWSKVKNDLDDLWLEGYSPHTEIIEIIDRHLKEVEE